MLEAIVSKEKLTEMRVDPETKVAFVSDKGGQLLTFDFHEVGVLRFWILIPRPP